MKTLLENLNQTANPVPCLIRSLYSSTSNIPGSAFGNVRVINLFNKPSVKKIINIEMDTDLTLKSKDSKVVLFTEFVGEGTVDTNTMQGVKSVYPNKDLYLIVDDTYEGLLTQQDVELYNSMTVFKEILILSSNEKITGDNVIDCNFHLYNPKFDNIIVQEHNENTDYFTRNKKFICLNRQERLHRLLTVDFLIENNLLPHSHVSCALDEFRAPLEQKQITKINSSTGEQDASEYWSHRGYGSFDEVKNFKPTTEQKQRLLANLPLVADVPQYQMNPRQLPDIEEYFDDSYWGIITERDFYKSDVYQGWTEKVLKCFLYKIPFVVVGLPNTIKSLQDYGFITFNKYIDESYDSIEDNDKRMAAVFEQIKYLGNLNYSELDIIHKDMHNILAHNYSHYKNMNLSVPSKLINHMQGWFRNPQQQQD